MGLFKVQGMRDPVSWHCSAGLPAGAGLNTPSYKKEFPSFSYVPENEGSTADSMRSTYSHRELTEVCTSHFEGPHRRLHALAQGPRRMIRWSTKIRLTPPWPLYAASQATKVLEAASDKHGESVQRTTHMPLASGTPLIHHKPAGTSFPSR